MQVTKAQLNKYNRPDTLLVLTSFPQRGGEVALENAIARYSHLLVTNFPEHQRVVVICEKRKNENSAYELADNILVVPSYTYDSYLFGFEVNRVLKNFKNPLNLLVQFEFHIFGGKGSIPGILAVLFSQALAGKNVSIMLHQVVSDINSLSGHLGLAKGGTRAQVFNALLRTFYVLLGVACNKVLVHDSLLKKRLESYIKWDKIVVIPHGSGLPKRILARSRTETRQKLGLKKGDVALLVFGYLSWYKGSDWIVANVGPIIKKHPEFSLKLVLAGGESPTLKETASYKAFSQKLRRIINTHKNGIITTGFVPEAEVDKLFQASDVVIFPYRTKMSASGALSLAWQYGRPTLASSSFSQNFQEADVRAVFGQKGITIGDISFKLNKASFERALVGLLANDSLKADLATSGRQVAQLRSWGSVAESYLGACKGAYVPSFGLLGRGDISYAANENSI
jgi:glycosyltransferase involved in cell wall biosynthesis